MGSEAEFIRSSWSISTPPSWYQIEDRVDILVGQDINYCRETAINEMEVLEFSPVGSAEERVSRLLFLLQRDVLASYIGGMIMEKKALRDAFFDNHLDLPSYALKFAGARLTPNMLFCCGFGVLFLFIIMFIYVLYFALVGEAEERQIAWLYSFLIWVVLDVLLVSTFEVLVTHLALPYLVMRDLKKVREEMRCLLDKYQQWVTDEYNKYQSGKEEPSPGTAGAAGTACTAGAREMMSRSLGGSRSGVVHTSESARSITTARQVNLALQTMDADRDDIEHLNSAQYFFVSYRLSKYFSDLAESRFIQQYASQLPPGSMFPFSLMRPLNSRLHEVGGRPRTDQNVGPHIDHSPYRWYFGWHLFSYMAIALLNGFVFSSFFMQDLVVQFGLACFIFFLLLLHLSLYNAMIYLAALPLVLLLLGWGLYLCIRWIRRRWRLSRRERSIANHIAVRPATGTDMRNSGSSSPIRDMETGSKTPIRAKKASAVWEPGSSGAGRRGSRSSALGWWSNANDILAGVQRENSSHDGTEAGSKGLHLQQSDLNAVHPFSEADLEMMNSGKHRIDHPDDGQEDDSSSDSGREISDSSDDDDSSDEVGRSGEDENFSTMQDWDDGSSITASRAVPGAGGRAVLGSSSAAGASARSPPTDSQGSSSRRYIPSMGDLLPSDEAESSSRSGLGAGVGLGVVGGPPSPMHNIQLHDIYNDDDSSFGASSRPANGARNDAVSSIRGGRGEGRGPVGGSDGSVEGQYLGGNQLRLSQRRNSKDEETLRLYQAYKSYQRK